MRGFKGIQLLPREVDQEVGFATIMTLDELEAVRDFAGEDYEAAVVPLKARKVLARFAARSQQHKIIAERLGIGQEQ